MQLSECLILSDKDFRLTDRFPFSDSLIIILSGCDDISLTIVEPIDSTGAGEGPQELCQHVHGELLQRQLPQDDHGQRNSRVDVGSCDEQQTVGRVISLKTSQTAANKNEFVTWTDAQTNAPGMDWLLSPLEQLSEN